VKRILGHLDLLRLRMHDRRHEKRDAFRLDGGGDGVTITIGV
jgi:hypothetical protein